VPRPTRSAQLSLRALFLTSALQLSLSGESLLTQGRTLTCAQGAEHSPGAIPPPRPLLRAGTPSTPQGRVVCPGVDGLGASRYLMSDIRRKGATSCHPISAGTNNLEGRSLIWRQYAGAARPAGFGQTPRAEQRAGRRRVTAVERVEVACDQLAGGRDGAGRRSRGWSDAFARRQFAMRSGTRPRPVQPLRPRGQGMTSA
jgi:hypothetical protein